MIDKKKRLCERIWYLGIFAFLYLWFTQVHPLVVFDADDWTYLVSTRGAWPIWGAWNPAKVFPEVFLPFCSAVGYYLLMPLLGDFITVMTVTHGFVVSVFITAYIFCFSQLLKRAFSLPTESRIFASALFLIFHFLALRSAVSGNSYLFYCNDLNCYYNYLLPALLNASLVMCMVKNQRLETFLSKGNTGLRGFFFLALYMAVFSNLTDSVILAVYAGAGILVDMVKQRKNLQLKRFLCSHSLFIVILAAWLVSAVFELSGGRAVEGAAASFGHNLKDAAYCLLRVLRSCNPMFLGACAVLVILALVLLLTAKEKETEDQNFLTLLPGWTVCTAAMVVCMTVLCAVVRVDYILRSEYLFGIFFYCLMFVLFCFAYVIQKRPKALLAVPILLCVLLSETNTSDRTFLESNKENVDAKLCAQISRDLVDQVVTAAQDGQREMTLCMPVWEQEDNWPHTVKMMDRIAYSLYQYGMIPSPITVTPVASPEMNEKYNLPVPDTQCLP